MGPDHDLSLTIEHGVMACAPQMCIPPVLYVHAGGWRMSREIFDELLTYRLSFLPNRHSDIHVLAAKFLRPDAARINLAASSIAVRLCLINSWLA